MKTEYLEVKIPADSFSEKLSELGMDGWQLYRKEEDLSADLQTQSEGTSIIPPTDIHHCIFSRPFTPPTQHKEVD